MDYGGKTFFPFLNNLKNKIPKKTAYTLKNRLKSQYLIMKPINVLSTLMIFASLFSQCLSRAHEKLSGEIISEEGKHLIPIGENFGFKEDFHPNFELLKDKYLKDSNTGKYIFYKNQELRSTNKKRVSNLKFIKAEDNSVEVKDINRENILIDGKKIRLNFGPKSDEIPTESSTNNLRSPEDGHVFENNSTEKDNPYKKKFLKKLRNESKKIKNRIKRLKLERDGELKSKDNRILVLGSAESEDSREESGIEDNGNKYRQNTPKGSSKSLKGRMKHVLKGIEGLIPPYNRFFQKKSSEPPYFDSFPHAMHQNQNQNSPFEVPNDPNIGKYPREPFIPPGNEKESVE